jgi:hypothetical protein
MLGSSRAATTATAPTTSHDRANEPLGLPPIQSDLMRAPDLGSPIQGPTCLFFAGCISIHVRVSDVHWNHN